MDEEIQCSTVRQAATTLPNSREETLFINGSSQSRTCYESERTSPPLLREALAWVSSTIFFCHTALFFVVCVHLWMPFLPTFIIFYVQVFFI